MISINRSSSFSLLKFSLILLFCSFTLNFICRGLQYNLFETYIFWIKLVSLCLITVSIVSSFSMKQIILFAPAFFFTIFYVFMRRPLEPHDLAFISYFVVMALIFFCLFSRRHWIKRDVLFKYLKVAAIIVIVFWFIEICIDQFVSNISLHSQKLIPLNSQGNLAEKTLYILIRCGSIFNDSLILGLFLPLIHFVTSWKITSKINNAFLAAISLIISLSTGSVTSYLSLTLYFLCFQRKYFLFFVSMSFGYFTILYLYFNLFFSVILKNKFISIFQHLLSFNSTPANKLVDSTATFSGLKNSGISSSLNAITAPSIPENAFIFIFIKFDILILLLFIFSLIYYLYLLIQNIKLSSSKKYNLVSAVMALSLFVYSFNFPLFYFSNWLIIAWSIMFLFIDPTLKNTNKI